MVSSVFLPVTDFCLNVVGLEPPRDVAYSTLVRVFQEQLTSPGVQIIAMS